MMLFVLLFFGVTFVYTGFLTISQNSVAGLALAVAGILCLIKPILDLYGYRKKKSVSGPIQMDEYRKKRQRRRSPGGEEERRKPTIH